MLARAPMAASTIRGTKSADACRWNGYVLPYCCRSSGATVRPVSFGSAYHTAATSTMPASAHQRDTTKATNPATQPASRWLTHSWWGAGAGTAEAAIAAAQPRPSNTPTTALRAAGPPGFRSFMVGLASQQCRGPKTATIQIGPPLPPSPLPPPQAS